MPRGCEVMFAGVTCLASLAGCSPASHSNLEVPDTSTTIVTEFDIGEPLLPNNHEILPAVACGELNQMLAGVGLLQVSGFGIATAPSSSILEQGLFAQQVAEILGQSADMLPQTLDQSDGIIDGNYDLDVYGIEAIADALTASKATKEATNAAMDAISADGFFVYEQVPVATELLEQARQTVEAALFSHC